MRRGKLTTIASVACGLLCAACVFAYLQGVRGEAEAARAEALARYGGEQLEVCVAKRDIAAGQTIASSDVEMRLWVSDLLPADAARSMDDVVGKAPGTPIMEGEVVVLKRFRDAAAALDVPDGLAALSVPAKDVQAVGGVLTEGAFADLYAVGGTSTSLLAEDVLILATSASGLEAGSAELSWVTVAVAPESVQEVIDASQKSELYFAISSGSSSGGGAQRASASDGAANAKSGDDAESGPDAGSEGEAGGDADAGGSEEGAAGASGRAAGASAPAGSAPGGDDAADAAGSGAAAPARADEDGSDEP